MSIRNGYALALLAALFCATAAPSATAQAQKLPDLSTLGVPGNNWVLQIQTEGFTLDRNQTADDGFGRMMMASNPATGVVLSVFLEKAPKKGNSHEAREYYWEKSKKSPVKKDDIKLSDVGNLPIVEYFVKEFQGARIDQKSVNAYLAKDDTWIDVHLSKVQFKPEDQALFDAILKSLKIVKNSAANSMTYAGEGSSAYLKGDYPTAIRHYTKAVELNKQDGQLNKVIWRVVVDNLGMAYGISGDLANAKKTFEFGLSVDPDYPMFHYNMGCTYGEMGDLDKAIASLRKAFSLRANMNAGEPMPNPATDSSFERFLNTDKFRAFLKEIGANSRK
jgi:tetratricopeptide (TPR) repeat protein